MPPEPGVATGSGGDGQAATGTAGNPSYAAYDYQIDATIWIGLELMLAKRRATFIEIEPPSHEDVEATLADPDTASLVAGAEVPGGRLFVQIKSRTTAPWTSNAFAEVLKGKTPKADSGEKRKGPAPRARPIAMLSADKGAKYLFVTNESIESGLRDHRNIELLSFPDPKNLPPHCRAGRSAATRAEMGGRIGICDTVTSEILTSRIRKLLDEQGNVPPQKWDDCIEELQKAVRARLKGEHGGRWTSDDLTKVLAANGGSRLAHRRYDQFVEPKSFQAIGDMLRDNHTVIIAGPSGTGKTLTADVIAAGLKAESPAFMESFPSSAGEARTALAGRGPIFLHLRDPWGDAALSPDAARWTAELPKLIPMGDVAHKILITTRSDVFERSRPGRDLRFHAVSIEAEDYDDELRAQIYDNHAQNLGGHAYQLAVQHRDTVLRRVGRPYEIERFLAALPREREEEPRSVYKILEDSSIDAISSVICAQVLGWGSDGIPCAAILWGLIGDGRGVGLSKLRDLLRVLRGSHGMTPPLEGFADFLDAGRNLRVEDDSVRLQHPRVVQGLRLALETDRAMTEAVLTATVEALLELAANGTTWAGAMAIATRRRASYINDVEINLGPASQAILDRLLVAHASERSGGSFEGVFANLLAFATPGLRSRRFAELLTHVPRPTGGWPMSTWVPPELTTAEMQEFRDDPGTAPILHAFIRGVLPFTNDDYENDFLEFAARFSDDLGSAYGDAVDALAAMHSPGDNIATIVAGALAPGGPGYDRVIDAFVEAEAEAGRWYESVEDEQRQAREHEVDAMVASHIIEQPGERHHNADAGLKAAAKRRLDAEGWDWLKGHKHAASLVYSLASDLLHSGAVPSALLSVFLELADDRALPAVWTLIDKNWHDDLRGDLETALAKPDIESENLRKTLAELAVRVSPPDGGQLFAVAAPAMSATRKLQLVRDIEAASDSDLPALAFAETLPPVDREIAHILLEIHRDTDIRTCMEGRSEEARRRIVQLLPDSPLDLAGILVCLAAPGPGDIVETARNLLATGDVDEGMPAITALRVRDGTDERALIREALRHPSYRVRRAAMAHLTILADPQDRPALLDMANDPGADVRLEWARLMREHRWPEAEPLLAGLLSDDRDFSVDRMHRLSWPRYSVARAAARALGEYPALSGDSIGALLATSGSADPFVHCASLRVLAQREEPGIPEALRSGLRAPGLNGDPDHRVTAQAAAWGFFYRVVDQIPLDDEDRRELSRTAVQDSEWIAGPALAALAIDGGEARAALHAELVASELGDRADLLLIAAAMFERPFGNHPLAEAIRVRAVSDDAAEKEAARQQLVDWYDKLPPEGGLPTRWLVATCLELVDPDDLEDPRAYRVPDLIPIMSLYTMSPYREEVGSPDEGY